MKVKRFLAMTALAVALVSCNQNEVKLIDAVSGDYNGTLEMSVQGNSVGTIDGSKVSLSGNDDANVKVVLAGFSAMDGKMNLGDIVIEGVQIKNEEDVYVLNGEIDTNSEDVHVTGSLKGSISKDGNAILNFEIKPGAMPMAIDAKFSGKK